MNLESLREPVVDAAVTVGYALASLLLTAAGLDAEYLGFARFGAGETVIGLWFGFMGLIALVAAGLLVRDRLLPRLHGSAA